MDTLSIWRFDTSDGAEPALRALERLQTRRVVAIDDAAVLVWPAGARRPHSYQAGTVSGTAALSGAFWGLVIGLLFLLPLAGPTVGAAVLARVGLPDDLLAEIRTRVVPGTSALFLLSDHAVPDRLRTALTAEPLVRTFTPHQQRALLAAFAAAAADDDPADTLHPEEQP